MPTVSSSQHPSFFFFLSFRWGLGRVLEGQTIHTDVGLKLWWTRSCCAICRPCIMIYDYDHELHFVMPCFGLVLDWINLARCDYLS